MDALTLRARALEQSFHKKESESALEEYRKSLEKEGKLQQPDDAADDAQAERRHKSHKHASTDKLAEIYGEETRLDRHLPVRRRFAHRNMPPIPTNRSESGRSRVSDAATSASTAPGAAVSIRQAMHHAASLSSATQSAHKLTPEEAEAMRLKNAVSHKAFIAGARSLAYGFAAAIVGTAMLARVGTYAFGVHDLSSARSFARAYTRKPSQANAPTTAAYAHDDCKSSQHALHGSGASVDANADALLTSSASTSKPPHSTTHSAPPNGASEKPPDESVQSKRESEFARRLKRKFGT